MKFAAFPKLQTLEMNHISLPIVINIIENPRGNLEIILISFHKRDHNNLGNLSGLLTQTIFQRCHSLKYVTFLVHDLNFENLKKDYGSENFIAF